jgi:hypothetical protein
VRLLSLVRDRAPATFRAWVNSVCASVGGGASGEGGPGKAGGGGGGEDAAGGGLADAIYLLNRVEETQVVEWPGWGQAPAGKAQGYLQVGPSAVGAARGVWQVGRSPSRPVAGRGWGAVLSACMPFTPAQQARAPPPETEPSPS